jgi:hypothetical protein
VTEPETFVCRQCGAVHAGLPTDWGYKKPDVIHALKYIDEYLRVRSNKDFCTLDESRYFIRGVLQLPFLEQDGSFGWGIWVEVSRENHDLYIRNFNEDASSLPRFSGSIANSMPGYPQTLAVGVQVQLGKPDKRPTLWLSGDSKHQLGSEQSDGLSSGRHHELLRACGHFNERA